MAYNLVSRLKIGVNQISNTVGIRDQASGIRAVSGIRVLGCGVLNANSRCDRQLDVRGLLRVVIDGLRGCHELRIFSERAAGIRIAVEVREIRRADLEPDPVPSSKDDGGVAELDR